MIITYFDEDVILKIRLNVLYDFVDKFIISEVPLIIEV